MIEFSDILYGKIRIPDWLVPFLKIPEFLRLRGVRLSNVDSYQFKDFAGPTRWEHCVAVAWLALRCAEQRKLSEKDRMQLALAALLHDVGTPPFAHTAEYVLDGFDHELQSQSILADRSDHDFASGIPVFASQLPRFRTTCSQLSKSIGVQIDPDEVSRMIIGDGDHGFLIHGSVDLDNADNVTRACRYMGICVDPDVPIQIADWLATLAGPPADLQSVNVPAISAWVEYRTELYSQFFNSSDEELARQAFLQHLMRRAVSSGMSRQTLLLNTDERLLLQMEQMEERDSAVELPMLRELVQRYRMLETPSKIAHVDIDEDSALQAMGLPQSVAWVEEHLRSPSLHPFAMVSRARHSGRSKQSSLFPSPVGTLLLFKLGGPLKEIHLPEFIRRRDCGPSDLEKHVSIADLSKRLATNVRNWTKSRPWSQFVLARHVSVVNSLNNFGNWSFRLSRNDSLHAYPGTFVHAIPSSLINSLGLQGDTIIDPFGGTGQTAGEAVKFGCSAISGDINQIGCLAARARLTYLSTRARERIRSFTNADIAQIEEAELPDFHLRQKWFHADTLSEIARIKSFIDRRRDAVTKQFLLASLSAVITSCTGRRGKEHGYFADNAPLEKGISAPPYQNAISEFLARVERNLRTIERLYVHLERDGADVEKALSRAKIVRADVQTATPAQYGVAENSIGAIITSPPYICMADYTLGQRLSYELLFPNQMNQDFTSEIGKRRQRAQRERALDDYRNGLMKFSALASKLVRVGGYVATVLGTPTAKNFLELDFTKEMDVFLQQFGFEKIWETWRPINWHRNHGYSRLERERVAVHVLRASQSSAATGGDSERPVSSHR